MGDRKEGRMGRGEGLRMVGRVRGEKGGGLERESRGKGRGGEEEVDGERQGGRRREGEKC